MMGSGRTYYPGLQSLRGGAATMVVVVHCIVCWSPLTGTDEISNALSAALLVPLSGRAAVILFFVLSGFVLSESLAAGGRGLAPWFSFYLRRACRIVPAAYAGLGATLIAIGVAARWLPDWENAPIAGWAASYFRSANAGNLRGSAMFLDNFINPVYWTLHVEIVGSLALPIFYSLIRRLPPQRRVHGAAALTILCLAAPFVPYRFATISHMSNAFLFCFPLGILTFEAVRRSTAQPKSWLPIGLASAVVLLFAHHIIGPATAIGHGLGSTEWLTPILGATDNIAAYLQHLIEALSAAGLIGAVAVRDAGSRKLGHGAVHFVGRVSYSLYVVHFPVLMIVISILASTFRQALAAHPWCAPLGTMVTVVPLSLAAAAILYRTVERPGIALGQVLARSLSKRGPPALGWLRSAHVAGDGRALPEHPRNQLEKGLRAP